MARQVGQLNRDKGELRALIQERVREFTELRHDQDYRENRAMGMTDREAHENAQTIVEEYDPVVQMALVAVDRRVKPEMQLRAASEVAQYVRPKLKSIEVTQDPEQLETLAQRQQLSDRLVGLLVAAATGKKEAAYPPAPSDDERGADGDGAQ